MDSRETQLFEKAPVTRAVLSLVVPTVISQLILVLYNMADTFFVGQTRPDQVAAANLACRFSYSLPDREHVRHRRSKPISRALAQAMGERMRTSAFCV